MVGQYILDNLTSDEHQSDQTTIGIKTGIKWNKFLIKLPTHKRFVLFQ